MNKRDIRMATPQGKAIYRTRAPGIESIFGIIKSCLGIRRFSRRGLPNVRCDWTWICTADNRKKLLIRENRSPDADPSTKKSDRSKTQQRPYASNWRVVRIFWREAEQY